MIMNKRQTIDEEENQSVYEVKSTWLEKCDEGKIAINIVLFKLFSSLFFGNLFLSSISKTYQTTNFGLGRK